MAQSTTNLGKIHVFPSESLYNQFKDIIADNDLALLKDDGAYIVAALLEQNGYVKFSNGLILQWGVVKGNGVSQTFPLAFATRCFAVAVTANIGSSHAVASSAWDVNKTSAIFYADITNAPSAGWYYAIGV